MRWWEKVPTRAKSINNRIRWDIFVLIVNFLNRFLAFGFHIEPKVVDGVRLMVQRAFE